MNSSLAHLTQHLPPMILDVQAVAKKLSDEHKPEPNKLRVDMLPGLLLARQKFTDRIADRKHYISQLAPFVQQLSEKIVDAKDRLERLVAEAKAGSFSGGIRDEIDRCRRELVRLESSWERESKALDVATRIKTATEKLLKDFDASEGPTIKKLRALENQFNRNSHGANVGCGDRYNLAEAMTRE
jgi:hypothetical protein